jgi:hypothetical protein
MSMLPPSRLAASATARSTPASSPVSATTATTRPPKSALSSAAAAARRARSRGEQRDLGAFAREGAGDRLADAPAAAGDEGTLALELEIHRILRESGCGRMLGLAAAPRPDVSADRARSRGRAAAARPAAAAAPITPAATRLA